MKLKRINLEQSSNLHKLRINLRSTTLRINYPKSYAYFISVRLLLFPLSSMAAYRLQQDMINKTLNN